jgi:ATP:corrinoid adenosyltransferase
VPSQPESLAELFRSLDLTLTIKANNEEDEAWACVLTRPDGRTYEIEMVSFFDVDPESGEEWAVEPTPTRVLSVLAGTDVESEDEDDAGAAEETAAEIRAFLGDEAYDLLLELDEGSFG